ncbi:MAG: Ldh family oxidoreductase [Planctomycetes bacterium]|nr:Ldh family oxidoreductase [Planctomycetota bacterium]
MPQATPDIPRDASQEVTVAADQLRQLVKTVLIRKGMFEAEADIAADRMVEADLRGIFSHGSRCLPKYCSAMDDGDIDPRALEIPPLCDTPAIAVIEASGGLGHVAATRGMELAIEKAREVGTGSVSIKKGQHFGAAAVYVQLAIDAGMIGFCTTSTGTATVAAFGSREPGTANNALAWGFPTSSGAPFILDMAVAEASWGKIETRGMYGLPIPAGWALDENGDETTNASAAKTLLPASGARGFGLAFVCSALTSSLIGRRSPIRKVANPFGPGSDHFFYAIDPKQFGKPDGFLDDMDATAEQIRSLSPAEGFDKVRLCGELEWERARAWSQEGIPMHRDSVEKLTEFAKSLGCERPEGWPA